MRTIEIPAGENLFVAAATAMRTADDHREPVQFEFNGVTMLARPGDTADRVLEPFRVHQRQLEQRRESEERRKQAMLAAFPDLLAACKAYYFGQKDVRECESMMRDAITKAEATHV